MRFLKCKQVNRFLIFFAVLMVSGSSFALNVGDTVNLLVPDVSYFQDEPQLRQFTCRGVTEHAYFLVQDTTFFDLPEPEDEFQLIWDNLINQAEIDSIAIHFEGGGVDVFDSVTSLFGQVPETVNSDEKTWVIMADIPDYFYIPGAGIIRIGRSVYVWPEDFDGDGSQGNNHDCFYVNLGVYKNMPGEVWEQVRASLHLWAVPTGFGQFLRIAHNRFEDLWVVRGLGIVAQFSCYGITSAFNGNLGINTYIDQFERGGGIELTSWCSGQSSKDFAGNQGGEFLWFKYLEQRVSSSIIAEIVQSDKIGIMNIASAINSDIPDSIAVEVNVYPLYEDWLITNIVADVAGDFAGGIYRYEFLDEIGFEFTMIDDPASFIGEFDSYPFSTWIAPHTYGISAQSLAAQYISFEGDYSSGENKTVFFNGMYNVNDGSGSNINGRWIVHKVVFAADSSLLSVDSLEFDDYFNGTFELEGARTYLVLTNNNPGGTANIRYIFSQDTASKSLFLFARQNNMNEHFLQVYVSLFREDSQLSYGFDWVGPKLELSSLSPDGSPDSTAIIEMTPMSSNLWSAQAYSWLAGNFKLVCSGYDSLGVNHADSLFFAVGYGGTGKLALDVLSSRLEVAEGSLAPTSQVSLIETNTPALSVNNDIPLNPSGTVLPTIIEGPVAVYPGVGVISFPADNCDGAIFHLAEDDWIEVESYFLAGRMCAIVLQEGIYIYGESPGVASPEISSEPFLDGSYPNPFTSQVVFRFSLPESSIVSLDIFDMSGRVIGTVTNGTFSSGLHTIVWDSNDSSGSPVSSGIYFARFHTSEYSETLKLVKVGSGGIQ